MTITDTFVTVAPDCPAKSSVVPVPRGEKVPVHLIQYELLTARPYELTLIELICETTLRREAVPGPKAKARAAEIRAELERKPPACMRASALMKKYGWGAHYDAGGKLAIFAMESPEYARFSAGKVRGVKVVPAMRSKRE